MLTHDADTEEFSDLLAEIINHVRLHVRGEEEHLFLTLADHLSPAELTELGDMVRAAKDRLPDRSHPLTPKPAAAEQAVRARRWAGRPGPRPSVRSPARFSTAAGRTRGPSS